MSAIWIIIRNAIPMLMHDPPHPGAVIQCQCLGLAVIEAAKGLAVSRNTMSLQLKGTRPRWSSGCRKPSATAPKAAGAGTAVTDTQGCPGEPGFAYRR